MVDESAPAEIGPAEGAAPASQAVERRPSAPLPPGFIHRRVVVDVPASTANLGAGYDTLAMALDLRDRIEVEVVDSPGLELSVEGEGAGVLPASHDNRFIVALDTGLRWALGQVPPEIGFRVHMANAIPLARGLGSSAAATVAGLVAANALTGDGLDQRRLLTLCIEIEGHPDNAAAALLGGFVVIALVDGRPETVRFDAPRDLRAVLFVPDLQLPTSEMRAALPREVPHRDAVFNLGRVALAVAGLASGRYDVLRAGTEDRLHEPYRAQAYPALPKLIAAARAAGAIGACLSGSGSTVLAFGASMSVLTAIGAAFMATAAEAGLGGSVRIVSPRNAGAVVIEAD
ncbi:MAG: homoserine kinase [Candidatus Limnocylindrales bacterium]